MSDFEALEGGGDVGAGVGGGNGESHQHARGCLIVEEDDGVVRGVSESRSNYSKWRTTFLRDECLSRGIPVPSKARPEDMVVLLQRSDAADDRDNRQEAPRGAKRPREADPPPVVGDVYHDALLNLQQAATNFHREIGELSTNVRAKEQEDTVRAIFPDRDLGSERGNREYATLMKVARIVTLAYRKETLAEARPLMLELLEVAKDRALEVLVGYREGWGVVGHLSRRRDEKAEWVEDEKEVVEEAKSRAAKDEERAAKKAKTLPVRKPAANKGPADSTVRLLNRVEQLLSRPPPPAPPFFPPGQHPGIFGSPVHGLPPAPFPGWGSVHPGTPAAPPPTAPLAFRNGACFSCGSTAHQYRDCPSYRKGFSGPRVARP